MCFVATCFFLFYRKIKRMEEGWRKKKRREKKRKEKRSVKV